MLSLIHRGWLHRRRGRSNGRKGWRAPRIRNDRGGKVPNIATRIAPACQQHRACRGLREWTTRPPRRALLRRAPHLPLMLTLRSEDCMPMQLHPSQHGPCCVGPGSAPCTPCAAHCCVASESSLLECGLCVGSRGVNRPVRLWACGGCRNLCPRAPPRPRRRAAGPAPHTPTGPALLLSLSRRALERKTTRGHTDRTSTNIRSAGELMTRAARARQSSKFR